MRKKAVALDVSSLPEVLSLAEQVQSSGTPRVLKQGDRDIAVLSPAEPLPTPRRQARRRRKLIPKSDSIFNIVGIIRTEGPTDVSENKHKYLAEAYYAESHDSSEQ